MDMSITTKESDWMDTLIVKLRTIEYRWKLETLTAYREGGQAILNCGYFKGEWHNDVKQEFLKRSGYKERTFEYMIKLGQMPDTEFRNVLQTSKSLHAWANPQKALPSPKKARTVKVEKEIIYTSTPPQSFHEMVDAVLDKVEDSGFAVSDEDIIFLKALAESIMKRFPNEV